MESEVLFNFFSMLERAMGIEPNADCLEATEYTSFLLSPLDTLEHDRHYFLDRFAVSIPETVGIDPKSDEGSACRN
jgi:hypothetical protein